MHEAAEAIETLSWLIETREADRLAPNEVLKAWDTESPRQRFDLLSELPVELSLHILDYISVVDLSLRVSFVCRTWNELAQDGWLWRRLVVPESAIFRPRKLLSVSHKLQNVRHLDLTSPSKVSAKDLEPIFPFLTSLNRLQAGFVDDLTPRCIQIITKNCPHLEHVNLEGCAHVTNRTLHLLKSLVLKSLNLSHCTEIGEDDLIDLIKNQPKLTYLNVDGIPWTSVQLCSVLKERPLVFLHLDGAEMEDDCLECVSRCRKLENLSISFCEEMSDAGLLSLSSLRCLKSLRLKKGFGFSSYGFTSLFWPWENGPGMQMTCLHLTECTAVDDQVVAVMAACFVNLRLLDLAWCWEITDAGVASILQNLRHLEQFNACGLNRIIGIPFTNIPNQLPKLKLLDCRQCHSVQDPILYQIASLMPQLTIIDYYDDVIDGSARKSHGLASET